MGGGSYEMCGSVMKCVDDGRENDEAHEAHLR